MRKKIQKEVCQIPVVIWANIMAMSVENNIPVTIVTKAGQTYTGIIRKPFELYRVGISGSEGVFLSKQYAEKGTEFHACIPYASIDSISFTTEAGMLDELIDNLN